MATFRNCLQAARKELPSAPLAALASICFSLAILTAPFEFYHPPKYLTHLPLKLFAAAFYAFVLHWLFYRPRIDFSPIKFPLAVFLCTNLISIWVAASLPLNRNTGYMILMFAIIPLAENIIVSSTHLEGLCQALFLEAAMGGVASIWQFVGEYRAALAQHPGQLYQYMTAARIHIRGLTVHQSHFACQQMLLFVALFAFLLFTTRPRPMWWGVMASIGISIALNLTRSAWLGCFVGAVYLVSRWRPRWLWLMPVALLASYIAGPSLIRDRVKSVFTPSADPSIAVRFEMWGAALRMIRRHPWAGVGPDKIELVYADYLLPGQTPINLPHPHLHNNFLQLAAERGLPTLAAFIWLMIALLWQFLKTRRILPRRRWIAEGAIAAWLAMMVQGCFDYNFGMASAQALFLFFVSTPLVAQRIQNRCSRRPEEQGSLCSRA